MNPESGQFNVLAKNVLETVQSGGKIIIIGWKASNHNDLTRRLEQACIVDFPTNLPLSASIDHFWLFTQFIPHKTTDLARKAGVRKHNSTLGTGEIKRLLKQLEQFIPISEANVARKPTLGDGNAKVTMAPIESDLAPSFAPHEEHPDVSDTEERSLRAFAEEFFLSVGHDPLGSLSRYEVARILEKHFGKKTFASKHPELLAPNRKEGGRKAGRYRATQKLIELATRPSDKEPTDPIEKARWLVGQKTKLEGERSKLVNRVGEIDVLLGRVEKAARLLEEMSQI